MTDDDFFSKGKCRGMPMDFFFPRGTSGRRSEVDPALDSEQMEQENAKLCLGIFCSNLSRESQDDIPCVVIEDCLKWALRNNEQGVLGGTSTGQRVELRKRLPM